MLRGSGRIRLAVVAVLLIVMLAAAGLQNSGHYAGGSQSTAPSEPQDAESEPVCAGSRFYQPPCAPSPQDYEQRGQWAEEQDLIAQRKMALWTVVVGICAIAGTMTSIAGVVLVLANLIATREIGQNQTKAYLWASKGSIAFPDRDPKRGRGLFHSPLIMFTLTVQNEGQTPATDVTAWATIQVFSGNNKNALARIALEHRADSLNHSKRQTVSKGTPEDLLLMMPEQAVPEGSGQNALSQFALPHGWDHTYVVEGVAQYRDVFGQWHHSPFKFTGIVDADGKFKKASRSEDSGRVFLKTNSPRLPDAN